MLSEITNHQTLFSEIDGIDLLINSASVMLPLYFALGVGGFSGQTRY